MEVFSGRDTRTAAGRSMRRPGQSLRLPWSVSIVAGQCRNSEAMQHRLCVHANAFGMCGWLCVVVVWLRVVVL